MRERFFWVFTLSLHLQDNALKNRFYVLHFKKYKSRKH